MPDELIDICDEQNNLTGEKKMKSEAHRLGLWHRAAHIWIHNSKGEIMIQLRAKDKPLFPNMWDISAAGHVSAGENPATAGSREAMEDIGLDISPDKLHLAKIVKWSDKYNEIINNEFYYVYFLQYDGDIANLKLQDEEVQAIKFIAINELENDLKNHPENYTPNRNDYWAFVIDEVKK